MLHDLIIWPNAIRFKEVILSDLQSEFSIVATFLIRWDDNRWFDNFRVFYSKSWQGLSSTELQMAITSKAQHCGTGVFLLVLFKDDVPDISFAQTSDGKAYVNTRVFNKKKEYRKLTGGGHLIHASNDETETDRDLALLLGWGVEDMLKQVGDHGGFECRLCRNCSGVDGYDSLASFFYVLNHSVCYCVLRNFEELPDCPDEQGHQDIDLLVENLSLLVNLTSAKPISGSTDRVDYSIRIGGKEIPFDFRYVGDNYYDPAWEKSILEHRVLERDAFYVPEPEDLYYSLLYHAYIQKRQVKPDYLTKLRRYGKAVGLVFDSNELEVIRQLDAFLEKCGYEFIKPKDQSVVYNLDIVLKSSYAYRYGSFIKRTQENGENGFKYECRIYEADDRFIKIGTDWLLANEAFFLNLLPSEKQFPKVKQLITRSEFSILEISKMEGVSFIHFFSTPANCTGRLVRSFIRGALEALRILAQKEIKHRDITPSNLILYAEKGRCYPSLIDFGWACNFNDPHPKTPRFLGGRYRPNKDCNDAYSLGIILMEWWPDLPYVRLIASVLFRTKSSKEDQLRMLNRALLLTIIPLDLYSEARLFIRRHHRVAIIQNKIRQIFK